MNSFLIFCAIWFPVLASVAWACRKPKAKLSNKLKKFTCLLLLAGSLFTGCGLQTNIRGGSFSHTSAAIGSVTTQRQSDSPKDKTSLNQDTEKTEEMLVPAGSLVILGTNSVKVASNTVYRVQIHDKVTSENGASQKNVVGETLAKLSSLKWISYLGVGLFLFGLGCAFYPPLKLLVAGSLTTAVAIAGGGLLLTVLPVLVVGHELIILCGVLGAIGIYWFSHRHGSIAGELKAIKSAFQPTEGK